MRSVSKKRGITASVRSRTRVPLVDEIPIVIPINCRGNRAWEKVDDETVIAYAKQVRQKNGIDGRKQLQKVDSGLYYILRKRGLLNDAEFKDKKRKRRNWSRMSDDAIVKYAKEIIRENEICEEPELAKFDKELYRILRKRELMDKTGLISKHRNWRRMNRQELIDYAQEAILKYNITHRVQLKEKDNSLYQILGNRNLLDKLFAEAERITEVNGKIKIPRGRDGKRMWKKVDDRTLVGYAKQIMEENNIDTRKKLDRIEHGLYQVLKRRNLIDEIFAEIDGDIGKKDTRKARKWSGMSYDEIIDYAKEVIIKKNIATRAELLKADSGLHKALSVRKLLDQVFTEMETQQKANSDQQAAEDMLAAVKELDAA